MNVSWCLKIFQTYNEFPLALQVFIEASRFPAIFFLDFSYLCNEFVTEEHLLTESFYVLLNQRANGYRQTLALSSVKNSDLEEFEEGLGIK